MIDKVLSSLSGGSPLLFGVLIILGIIIVLSFLYRVVVPTNMVHIVQSSKRTVSYGTGNKSNVYYRWPSWIPFIGVTTIKLPVSNFDLSFKDYEAYDMDRVPFMLDITSFFRIADTNVAAQRVSSIEQLLQQLQAIIQGAVRKILASHDINAVMTDRATFGKQFTEEIEVELESWGVETVKSIELMDMRDAKGSTVIADIMAKKSSHITMESRVEVAKNSKQAQLAEIEAQQEVDVRKQEAEQLVGTRTAQKDKEVGIAQQKSKQDIAEEQKVTTEKEMEVKKVTTVRQAEIEKESAIVVANQTKETAVLVAQGNLDATKLEAQGIETKGKAEAEAEKAKLLAPVQAQIDLAKEIGDNQGYQNYLILLNYAEVYKLVGAEQAKALQSADVKIIANGGSASEGIKSTAELFSAKGGLSIAAMLEALGNTPQGQKVLESLGGLLTGKSEPVKPSSPSDTKVTILPADGDKVEGKE